MWVGISLKFLVGIVPLLLVSNVSIEEFDTIWTLCDVKKFSLEVFRKLFLCPHHAEMSQWDVVFYVYFVGTWWVVSIRN